MAEVVAILDSDGVEILDTITNIGVSVSISKTFAQHSLENSEVVVDDQYDNPDQLTLRVILNPSDYTSVYKQIKEYYEAITNFTIQTKVDVFTDMYLMGMPHEEDPSMFNTIAMNLSFTQQIIVESTTTSISVADVSNAGDSDTTDSGSKSTTEDDDGTVASRAFSRVFG